jgi:putative DNA methylase
MTPKKKLIEVALPLDAINKASAREKSIRHGHPSTLHLWWARRPLAAARAVIFAQMVDDPSAHPDIFKTEKAQEKERQRLFKVIEELVKWENTTNEKVLQQARDEIWQSWRSTCAENADHPRAKELFDRHKLPAFYDPFAGGGSLPLEAQRLGLDTYASDLNPVAVLINKAMIEIPPKFAGRPPVNPEARQKKELFTRSWPGAQGLAEDVRHYGRWMRQEAEKRVGHLYPKIEITPEMVKDPIHPRPDLKALVGKKLTIIAWLWTRTVKSPNPAFAHVDVPLASTFMLSTKTGKESYVEPVVEGDRYRFAVRVNEPENAEAAKNGTKLARGANFRCLMSGAPIAAEYIYAESNGGRLGAKLMAVVAEADRGRVYVEPTPEVEAMAVRVEPAWKPDVAIPENPRWFSPPLFGLKTYGDLFTPRQLVTLTTFSDLVQEARDLVRHDASGIADLPNSGPSSVGAYADAVVTYLAFALSKSVDGSSTICRWMVQRDSLFSTFSRQALPMTWDFAEVNLLADCTRSISESIAWTAESIEGVAAGYGASFGEASQADAMSQEIAIGKIISTDPPYYDNIGYADLSDFFYIWLRRSLKGIYPDLFTTLAVPKAEELVATPSRHGGKENAERFFLTGMTKALIQLASQSHPAFPVTIYYAFKQSEAEGEGSTVSTGWQTFLDAVIRAGFAISGTWPMRTEREGRSIGIGTNSLASSIILSCRPRIVNAPTATRRDFLTALKNELPTALAYLQRSNIAPVDLAQAAIGPGMAIYTRYAQVLDAEGKPVAVRDALALINQALDEVLAAQEGDFDADTRWALAWFEQSGFAEDEYGVAETLSKAKNTSVSGLVKAGFLASKSGKVRLFRPKELPASWDPNDDQRLTVWEIVHHLIRVLEADGEGAAAELVAKIGSKVEITRELCYRLYTLCERKKRAAEALSYNGLVQSWPEITRLAREGSTVTDQPNLPGTE